LRGGLTARLVIASAVLALTIATLFVTLLLAIDHQRDAAGLARHSQLVLVAAADLERFVVDLESGERGYALTHDESFLQPWTAAVDAIPTASRILNRLAAVPEQHARALRINDAVASYVRDYSVPTVEKARRGDPSAASTASVTAGKRRVDSLKAQFRGLVAAEKRLAATRDARADDAARQAIVAASVGLVGLALLIIVYVVSLQRVVVRPVRRAAVMAGQLAEGDLSVRMPETGTAEIRALEHSFNTMGSSLEESRDELAASRARVVAASDDTRRRIERDLHDGTQQRLVSLALDLTTAEKAVPPELTELRARLRETAKGLNDTVTDLQEISRGIHPAILSKGGLGAALRALVRRSALPVQLELDAADRRLPERVEVAAYYVVSEGLTNAAKHARASAVRVVVSTSDELLVLSIRDDGVGGADASRGSGLIGLRDRVESLGGTLEVVGRAGDGTSIVATIPISVRGELDE
jgi:signal transduction histidine kinase